MESVHAFHQDALVIDTHNDTIVAHIRRGVLGLSGAPAPDRARRNGAVAGLRGMFGRAERAAEIQIDFPKMRAGGIDVGFFAVDVTLALKNYLTYALDAFGFFDEEVEQSGGEVVVARSAQDILAAKQAGKLAAVMAVENSDVLEGSLNVLRMLHKMGVRSIGLTHNVRSLAADGNAETDGGGGLTTFGVRLVQEMNRLGMLVDVAHINERGFFDVMENIWILILILAYPAQPRVVAWLSTFFTTSKYVMSIPIFLLLMIGLVKTLMNRFKVKEEVIARD